MRREPGLRVCHVTPHLPPEQAANAILPVQLARELSRSGTMSSFVSHYSERFGAGGVPDAVAVAPRRGQGGFGRSPAGALVAAARMAHVARGAIAPADLVHLHSNGFLIEVAAGVARRLGRPAVITLYGTDIWDHDRRRHRRFRQAVEGAAARVFYSQALRDFASTLGLSPPPSTVIYAPVDVAFDRATATVREQIRRDLGVADRRVVLTVKRLHAVAGYETAIAAFAAIASRVRDAMWVIAGYGDLRPDLEAEIARRGLSSRVRFLGLTPQEVLPRWYAAADVFMLASRVESWGAVTLEALASGTPVVATATAGSREVANLFPADVSLVDVGDTRRLADLAVDALDHPRRTHDTTAARIDTDFRIASAAASYLDLYRRVVASPEVS
jgi:glycosyltransferase involved in cell wall biosynthesis